VQLDFGASPFLGEARWLEVAVRPTGIGTYSTLTPRQPLTPAPYAISAPWTGVSGRPWEYSAVRSPNITTTLDTSNSYYTSITVGIDGLGLISYWNNNGLDLKVAHCNNVACTNTTNITLDPGLTSVGQYTSITIGADGLGLISYEDETNGDLKVAHCNNVACTSSTNTTIDTGGANAVGDFTSITIGADGLGLISYHDGTNGDLKVAHCNDIVCTSATTTTLDTGGANDVGRWTSITTGTDGLGLISYGDNSNGDLKVAHCSNVACTSSTNTTLDSTGFVGYESSITIGTDGLGLISYWDNSNDNLKVAHCSNVVCTSSTNTAIDTGTVGQWTSITIGTDGFGLVSYYETTNDDLKVAHCSNVACTSATSSVVETSGTNDGAYNSITIGADGLPLISYRDSTNLDLKVAHCGSPLCIPYRHRR
jgi:hypothetical protein